MGELVEGYGTTNFIWPQATQYFGTSNAQPSGLKVAASIVESIINNMRNQLDSLASGEKQLASLSKWRSDFLRIIITGRVHETLPVMKVDTGEWYEHPTSRVISQDEKDKYKALVDWIDAERQLTKDQVRVSTKPPVLPHERTRKPLVEMCKNMCEDMELPKGETISREAKYEIAKRMDLDDLPPLDSFRAHQSHYQRVSKWLSELGYTSKEATKYKE